MVVNREAKFSRVMRLSTHSLISCWIQRDDYSLVDWLQLRRKRGWVGEKCPGHAEVKVASGIMQSNGTANVGPSGVSGSIHSAKQKI